MKFTIPGEFTDLNTYSTAERSHRLVAAKIKRSETDRVVDECIIQKVHKALSQPLVWRFRWYCKNKRKDPDGISFGAKFILDGLQKAGVIDNDGWKQVSAIHHTFHVDVDNPRVHISATVV